MMADMAGDGGQGWGSGGATTRYAKTFGICVCERVFLRAI